MGMLVLMLLTFKKVKLIFGHPVSILPVVRHKMYYNAGYKDASYKMR